MNKNKIMYLFAAAIILIAVLVIFLTNNTKNTFSSNGEAVDSSLLVGEWVRTDASYLIKINKVNENGTLEAQYFNPKPINVGKANWEENHGNLKIIVELRDVNYPGSTYTLNYLADKDILAGDYYQAVQGLTFYVEFERMK